MGKLNIPYTCETRYVYQKNYRLLKKKQDMEKLGGVKCALCGCLELPMLTIDHSKGGGRDIEKKVLI